MSKSPKKNKIAISVGDINGIGIELALNTHETIKDLCSPIYCINKKLLKKAALKLKIKVPKDFKTHDTQGNFKIKKGRVSKKSGQFSYDSLMDAITLTKNKQTQALVTLPINKEAWSKAGITYKGHTEVLRDHFKQNAIMMLGCSKMFVALYTEHIPLKEVPQKIKSKELTQFLLDFHECTHPSSKVAVLGLNPHASDNGVLGNEEKEIIKAIKKANKIHDCFEGPCVPDTIFSKAHRNRYKYFIAMYHDQGLAPLKALYFDESINVSLNLPII
ncbi:MAG: 4-hydroxythreonine-4-phosphate dehydrogenase, partial [Campylobacteraceae bacterium]|nr:4-hydroxythreonine-4-phosphate dehydrogenase [Campylobacteraceae bacterium]